MNDQHSTPAPDGTTAVDELEEDAAPIARRADARGDFAVVAELLPYLRPYLGRIGLALALILGAKLANMLVPVALKKIVDQLGLEPGLRTLPVALLLAYGGARIGVTLFTELRQVVFARVMARASRQITLKVFRHLHRLSLKFHLGRRTGGIARDVERGGSAISDLLDWTLYTIVPTALEVLMVTAVLVWAVRLELRPDHARHAGGLLGHGASPSPNGAPASTAPRSRPTRAPTNGRSIRCSTTRRSSTSTTRPTRPPATTRTCATWRTRGSSRRRRSPCSTSARP